ncbi:hypothetical protein [Spirosoma utsteinense]|uniref:hypothetical protein n=1 Tax=Spirosoma utsteinense TaxID=2585773 RepID=UPI001648C50A|nr:hypothetical protein [Spirosoma utsteinense]MBC3789428.1 hypothetical protein [Spirosoma utsteinense]
MTELSLELYHDLTDRFKQNKTALLVMIPFALISVGFEISQLQSRITPLKKSLIYLIVLPYIVTGMCVWPIVHYFKALRIVESYLFNPATMSWRFNTLAKKSFEISEVITETEGTFNYFGCSYKTKIFLIGKKKYYFPIEIMS